MKNIKRGIIAFLILLAACTPTPKEITCQHTYATAFMVMTKEITEGVQVTNIGQYGWVDRSYLIPVTYCTKCGAIKEITPTGLQELKKP